MDVAVNARSNLIRQDDEPPKPSTRWPFQARLSQSLLGNERVYLPRSKRDRRSVHLVDLMKHDSCGRDGPGDPPAVEIDIPCFTSLSGLSRKIRPFDEDLGADRQGYDTIDLESFSNDHAERDELAKSVVHIRDRQREVPDVVRPQDRFPEVGQQFEEFRTAITPTDRKPLRPLSGRGHLVGAKTGDT